MGAPIRIMVIDTLLAVREGLGAFLDSQHGFKLVAAAQTAQGAEAIWNEARPDVVLVELELSDGRGARVGQRLELAHPEARFIYLSNARGSGATHGLDGASVIRKGAAGAELCEAIRQAVRPANGSAR